VPQNRIDGLRKIKAERKLSYETLGRKLGVHAISVFRWLKKGVVPKNRLVLQAIDRFLAKKNGNRTQKGRRLGQSPYNKDRLKAG